MRSECSGRDAEEVIEIMKAGMVDCSENELKPIDGFSESQTGARAPSKSAEIKRFVDILLALQKKEGRKKFHLNELKELVLQADLKIKGANAVDVIDILKANNVLLIKDGGYYELSINYSN